jgi:agmatinase
MSFNPNGVGVANGNIFGFPVNEENADIVIIPIPWDVTASYGKGTSRGPEAILRASTQLDFFHPKLEKAFNTKVFMAAISEEWLAINDAFNAQTPSFFEALETVGEEVAIIQNAALISEINEAHQALKSHLKERAADLLRQGKCVGVLGGEHSVPLGLMEALGEHYQKISILQIDAHADLRKSYEGFEQSHASIMYNATQLDGVAGLVQVGIRDYSEEEHNYALNHPKIKTFYDWELKEATYKGKTWDTHCEEIINTLTENVYISWDIDGLWPYLCPHTGTPVPGGFEVAEIGYLLFKLVEAGKRIVGFDLNEVSPGAEGDWDANVGARCLWQLVCATQKSRL